MIKRFKSAIVFLLLFSLLYSKQYYRAKQVDKFTLNISGDLISEASTLMKSPQYWNTSYRIIELIPEGKYVSKGDTLIKFNPAPAQKALTDAQNQLKEYLYQKKIVLQENQSSLKQIESQIKKANLQIKSIKNRLTQAQYTSDKQKKEIELELKRAQINVDKNKRHLKSQKLINQKKLNEIEFKVEQARDRVQFQKKLLESLTITAPKEGVIVYFNSQRENAPEIAKGNKISPDKPLLKIPNLNKMAVKAEINEIDRFGIESGQPVQIKLSAFPDTSFRGTITNISPLPKTEKSNSTSSTIKVFPVNIEIHSSKNYRLKPGLSARVTVTTDSAQNYYSLPSWCIFKQGNKLGAKNTNGEFIELDSLKIENGKAYFKNDISKEKLISNQNIPEF